MLAHVTLAGPARQRAFDAVVADLKVLFSCELIHGDLSAYSVLYDGTRPRLIDLPQARDLATLPDPWPIFYRDVANICQHFQRQGMKLDPLALAMDLWRS